MNNEQLEKLRKLQQGNEQRKALAEAITTLNTSVSMLAELQKSTFEVLERAEKMVATAADRDVEIAKAFGELKEAIKTLELSPVIKVAAPIVNVPAANVKVAGNQNDDINARYKRARSEEGVDGVYHGFVDKNGNWFIQRETEGVKSASSGFYVGSGDFATGFPKYRSYKYVLFSEVNIP